MAEARSAGITSTEASHLNSSADSNSSGVSWSAVCAGAFVIAAMGLILLALGAGFGLSSISFGSAAGASASTASKGAVVWFIVLEIVSSSLGGYIAGRMRTRWTRIHSDEVYFRDTAHGFLAWSVALVITAAFLTSAAASMVGSPEENSRRNSGDHGMGPNAYYVDSLLRSGGKSAPDDASNRGEIEVILANDFRLGELPSGDKGYLAQLVAARTGMNQADAENEVTSTFANAQDAAEKARKAVAHSLLWSFLALLIGAFCAASAATIGGRQRDHVVSI